MATTEYFNPEAMMAAAEREAGCNDWGPEDIRGPFRILADSLNTEANLTPLGRERARSHLHTNLLALLRLINDRKVYPGIVKQQIRKPIFLTGPQRAGTSYLNAIMTSDPKNLGLWQWQVAAPSPPANHPSIDHAPQIAYGQHLMESEGWLDDYVRDKHDYSALVAAEDTFVSEYSLISVAFPFYWGVPTYGAFVATADNGPAYRIEKMLLQALQYGVEGRQWVLKSPLHLSLLGTLFDVFPDARVVINHRDPTKIFSSLLSLLSAHRKQFGCPLTHDRSFALGLMEGIALGMEDMIRRRNDPAVNSIFVDINYIDLENAPIAQVEKIYDRFGLALDDTARAAMKKYIAENRKGKHGKHQHRLEDSGLKEGEVRERFKFYTDRFGVPRED
jgi:hypothetical protein